MPLELDEEQRRRADRLDRWLFLWPCPLLTTKAAGLSLNFLEYLMLVAVRLAHAQAGQERTTSTEYEAMDCPAQGCRS